MGSLDSQVDGSTEITDEQITAVKKLLASRNQPDADSHLDDESVKLISAMLGLDDESESRETSEKQ